MIRSILKISLFIPLLFSCQNDKKDEINNFSVDKNSFLINIVRIVDNTEACRLTHRLRALYSSPVGDVYKLKTLDHDKVLVAKEVYREVFDVWKDKSLMVKNAYEGKISYHDQIAAIRHEIGTSSFYFLTFGKTRYDWDFEYNEFTDAWVNQFDRAHALNFSLVVIVLMSFAMVVMGLSRYVKKFRYLVYIYGFFYIISIIIPVYLTTRSSNNVARMVDQIIEIIQPSPDLSEKEIKK
jgi:hypothetical protein